MKARAAPGPPSPPQPTTRPTAERQGHAEAIEAPVMNGALRPWWTAHDRLGGLLRDGLIDRPDHEAAAQLRSDIEAAGGRVSSHMPRIGVPIGGGGGRSARTCLAAGAGCGTGAGRQAAARRGAVRVAAAGAGRQAMGGAGPAHGGHRRRGEGARCGGDRRVAVAAPPRARPGLWITREWTGRAGLVSRFDPAFLWVRVWVRIWVLPVMH